MSEWFPITQHISCSTRRSVQRLQRFTGNRSKASILIEYPTSPCRRIQAIDPFVNWFCIALRRPVVCARTSPHTRKHTKSAPYFLPRPISSCWFPVVYELFPGKKKKTKKKKKKSFFFLKLKMFTIGIFFPRLPVWDIQSFNKTGETEEEK